MGMVLGLWLSIVFPVGFPPVAGGIPGEEYLSCCIVTYDYKHTLAAFQICCDLTIGKGKVATALPLCL